MDMQNYETIKKSLFEIKNIVNNPNKRYILEKVIYPDGIKYIKKEIK